MSSDEHTAAPSAAAPRRSDGADLGVSSTILLGVRIGQGVQVGAGAQAGPQAHGLHLAVDETLVELGELRIHLGDPLGQGLEVLRQRRLPVAEIGQRRGLLGAQLFDRRRRSRLVGHLRLPCAQVVQPLAKV